MNEDADRTLIDRVLAEISCARGPTAVQEILDFHHEAIAALPQGARDELISLIQGALDERP